MLIAALEWLSQGQTKYRSAAVEGTIVNVLDGIRPETTLGSILTRIEDPHMELPHPRAPWPQGRFETPSQGRYRPRTMAFLTHSNTLDGWGTFWFLDLISHIRYNFDTEAGRQPGYLDRPVLEPMNVVRQTQQIRFRFFPNRAHPATNGDVSLALRKLLQVFLSYGARELEFTLRDERREALGVGYCDCLTTAPTIDDAPGDVISINAVMDRDIDGLNRTTADDGPASSTLTILSEAGLANSSSLHVDTA
ncbi:MAG: hypothetical protein Q9182_004700 [Xanthomendoza sp. 2 TL-2023]